MSKALISHFTTFATWFGIPQESRPRLQKVYVDQYHEALGKAQHGEKESSKQTRSRKRKQGQTEGQTESNEAVN